MVPTVPYQVLAKKNERSGFYTKLILGALIAIVCIAIFSVIDDKKIRKTIQRVLHHESGKNATETTPPVSTPSPKAETIKEVELETTASEWFSVKNKKNHWAIVIAGSREYTNYRHQADVCHAFQILRGGRIPESQIITFVFDDIAHNRLNPYKDGQDVYLGCAKDYTQHDVNKFNFLAALTGDEQAVKSVGSGRVIPRNKNNKIFIFYSDHGSSGSIGMPSSSALYADELNQAINRMIVDDAFSQMLIYLESCESGSMFHNFDLNKQNKVFVATASGKTESSYATYCPKIYEIGLGFKKIRTPAAIRACLGDLFSVSWMEYAESHEDSEVRIDEQMVYVKNRTSDYGTYFTGSHVKFYGDADKNIQHQVMGNFLSYYSVPSGFRRSDADQLFGEMALEANDGSSDVNEASRSEQFEVRKEQRDADLYALYYRELQNGEIVPELETELMRRRNIDDTIRQVVVDLIEHEKLPIETDVEEFVTKHVVDSVNGQVVDDWDCLRGVEAAWEQYCYPFDDYASLYGRAFANMCNQGLTTIELIMTYKEVC